MVYLQALHFGGIRPPSPRFGQPGSRQNVLPPRVRQMLKQIPIGHFAQSMSGHPIHQDWGKLSLRIEHLSGEGKKKPHNFAGWLIRFNNTQAEMIGCISVNRKYQWEIQDDPVDLFQNVYGRSFNVSDFCDQFIPADLQLRHFRMRSCVGPPPKDDEE